MNPLVSNVVVVSNALPRDASDGEAPPTTRVVTLVVPPVKASAPRNFPAVLLPSPPTTATSHRYQAPSNHRVAASAIPPVLAHHLSRPDPPVVLPVPREAATMSLPDQFRLLAYSKPDYAYTFIKNGVKPVGKYIRWYFPTSFRCREYFWGKILCSQTKKMDHGSEYDNMIKLKKNITAVPGYWIIFQDGDYMWITKTALMHVGYINKREVLNETIDRIDRLFARLVSHSSILPNLTNGVLRTRCDDVDEWTEVPDAL